jgi:Ca-activated chloride channel family protein
VFAFGIGSSVNRHLIEGIARAGQGEAFVVTQPQEAAAQAERLRRMIASPVLTQVSARFEGLDVYDVEPAQLPDVLGGRPVIVFGKWRGDAVQAAAVRLVVEGRSAEGPWRSELAAGDGGDADALRHLWARRRIALLGDQEALEGGDRQQAAITELGLKYGLLTQYTSFIAVDAVARNPNPALATPVDQPSPMPQGVSALAIGAAVPSTPEPSAWLALLVVLGIVVVTLVSARRRR